SSVSACTPARLSGRSRGDGSILKAADQPTSALDAAEPAPITGRASVLDVDYEQLRHAALHQRGQAFGLGFAALRRGGVTAWRRAVAALGGSGPGNRLPAPESEPAHPRSPTPRPPAPASPPAGLPAAVTSELVHLLAAVALAGTICEPRPERRAHVHRYGGLEGQRRTLGQDRVALCPPVHHPAGVAQHRVRAAPVRPAWAGDRVGVGR